MKDIEKLRKRIDWLNTLLHQIEDHIKQREDDPDYPGLREVEKLLPQISSRLQEFKGKVTLKGKRQRLFMKILWHFRKADFKNLSDDLEDYKDDLPKAFDLDRDRYAHRVAELQEAHRTKQDNHWNEQDNHWNKQDDHWDEQKAHNAQQKARWNHKDYVSIIKWLSPLNFYAKHHMLQEELCPIAEEWLLRSSELKEWESGQCVTLDCYGPMGVGKVRLIELASSDSLAEFN